MLNSMTKPISINSNFYKIMEKGFKLSFMLLITVFLGGCRDNEPKNEQGFIKFSSVRDGVYTKSKIKYKDTLIDLSKDIDTRIQGPIIPYFFSSASKHSEDFKKDENGVAIRKGGVYNPSDICRKAFVSYHNYKQNKNGKARKIFMDQVHWLEKNFYTEKNLYGYWLFPTKSWDAYGIKPYWDSALTQAWGIGVCFMAYDLTKNKRYLRMANLAFKGYLIPIQKGGFYRPWDGMTWFEEYPIPDKPSRVLNGFIFSLAGLKNYYDNTGNPFAKKLFNDGLETLKTKLPLYDAKFISRYRQLEGVSTYAMLNYHKLHIYQLLWLNILTGDSIYYDYAKKFLEMRRTQINGQKIKRIVDIKTSNNQKNVSFLTDEQWGWGKPWVAKEPTGLSFFFDGKQKINGFSIFYHNEESQGQKFKVLNDAGENITSRMEKIESVKHTSGNGQDTYIHVYQFENPIQTSKLILDYNQVSTKNKLKINQVYMFVDMEDQCQALKKTLKNKIKEHKSYNVSE